jgi:hypothetical protein
VSCAQLCPEMLPVLLDDLCFRVLEFLFLVQFAKYRVASLLVVSQNFLRDYVLHLLDWKAIQGLPVCIGVQRSLLRVFVGVLPLRFQ